MPRTDCHHQGIRTVTVPWARKGSAFTLFYIATIMLLAVRVFDDRTKKVAYAQQTKAAKTKGKPNCPLCAVGENANKSRIYDIDEMDADHVAAWSKGGDTSAKNCEMLCDTHNRAKGNR